MDIDLPRDYVFRAPSEDSDRESHHSSTSIPVPVAEVVEEVHSSNEEVIFTNFDPLEDRSGGDDEVMSTPDIESSTRDEDEELSPSEEKDEEEDPMEDTS